MFSYYGSKSKIINKYPSPKFDKIIEPFAGSARYALKWWDRGVILVDKYETIINIWKWLQSCSPSDILSLPKLKSGDSTENYNLTTTEKDFLGFLVTRGVESPRKNVSSFVSDISPALARIAKQVNNIKHWQIILGDYRELDNVKATWFIDPPYQYGGEHYVHSDIYYPGLAEWCRRRWGQVIVCENTKADWMDFKPVTKLVGSQHTTTEAMWSNYPHDYNGIQIGMNI